jgi:dihydroneopterin aldolase
VPDDDSAFRVLRTASRGTVQVSLHGMCFHVRVGILPHERELAQPLELDVSAKLSGGSAGLDYRALYDVVSGLVSSDPHEYLETIADAIAARVLALDGVRSCRVAVRKPHVALPGPLSYAEVVVERAAGD